MNLLTKFYGTLLVLNLHLRFIKFIPLNALSYQMFFLMKIDFFNSGFSKKSFCCSNNEWNCEK